MSGKREVKSWPDLLKQAKKDGESLGDTMKRMKERWSGPIKAGNDPEFVKVDAPPSPPKKRSSKKRKGRAGKKRKSGRSTRKRARSEPPPPAVVLEEEEDLLPPQGPPVPAAPAALAKAVGAFMDSCSVCPSCQGKVIAVLRMPRP